MLINCGCNKSYTHQRKLMHSKKFNALLLQLTVIIIASDHLIISFKHFLPTDSRVTELTDSTLPY